MKILFLLVFAIGMMAAAYVSHSDSPKKNDKDKTSDTASSNEETKNRLAELGGIDEDLQITQKIRESLFDDADLSLSAKNIKIQVKAGQVTLFGTVKNETERNSIAAKVKDIEGVTKVENKLFVSSDAI